LGIHSMVRRKIGCYVRPRGSNTEALARRSMKGHRARVRHRNLVP
jgi:hypothetical protein